METEYAALTKRLELNQGLPYSPDWSAAADFLEIVVRYCLDHAPSFILECGSGVSTLMLSRCCQINGKGKVVSLEDGAPFADRSRAYLERYGLDAYATVLHAPLAPVRIDDVDYQWYRREAIPEGDIDMFVIDGPSGFIGKNARYPALPLMQPRLVKGCRVFLDDAARPDEREIVGLWQSHCAGLQHEYLDTARGCSVLTVCD